MKYILDNVKKYEQDEVYTLSFLIDGTKVAYVSQRMEKLKHLRMSTDGFYLRAGKVMNDFELGNTIDEEKFFDLQKRLIQMGCTTVVVYSDIPYVRQFLPCLENTRELMKKSAIDYVIGIKVSCHLVTPTLVIKCKQEKIPIILVETKSIEQLETIVWERVKEAMIYYQPLIVPVLKDDVNLSVEEKNDLLIKCRKYVAEKKMLTYISFPDAHIPFEKNLCKIAGLYPKKGVLHVGSDVDYNLYMEGQDGNDFEPDIVVLRGKILKVNETIYCEPRFGEEVRIKVPGHFIPIDLAH